VDAPRRKPRAQRTRRVVAAASVVTMLSLGGAMAWSDAHASSTSTTKSQTSATTRESDGSTDDSSSSQSQSVPSSGGSTADSSATVTPHTSTGGS
jgi:hypothetical protein